ncbi:MAG: hypothetical protein P4M14_05110 [Gammaproteobacteria bacterium]|nr:hypothetical protein [Gammaproteobacteria bacterium]
MCDLKRKIALLEASILIEKHTLSRDMMILKQEMKTPLFLTTALIGGFAFGFMMGNKTTSKMIRDKAANIPHFLKEGLTNFRFLLPIISNMLL